MASAEKIDEIVRIIVANYDPDEIRIFGSHAKGTAVDRSDVDLLVLKETDEPFQRRVRTLEHLLHGMLLRLDINVYTRRELERAMERPYSLIARIVQRQARTVYSKRFPDFATILRAWESEESANRHARLLKDPSEWKLFQMLYDKESAGWIEKPSDSLAKRIVAMAPKTVVDLGCGRADLARSLPSASVTSIDHVALDASVLSADISSTTLAPVSFDAAVLSLALVGNNWRSYLGEAHRILREDGRLFLAEPQRRAGLDGSRLLDALEVAGFGSASSPEIRNGIVYLTATKVERAVPS
jgi:predicted nucleotidyltransferase